MSITADRATPTARPTNDQRFTSRTNLLRWTTLGSMVFSSKPSWTIHPKPTAPKANPPQNRPADTLVDVDAERDPAAGAGVYVVCDGIDVEWGRCARLLVLCSWTESLDTPTYVLPIVQTSTASASETMFYDSWESVGLRRFEKHSNNIHPKIKIWIYYEYFKFRARPYSSK